MNMETQSITELKNHKRPKSATRFPKKMPTFIVAFAMQEIYDDIAKHPVIDTTRSLQGSIDSSNSISSKDSVDSAKTFVVGKTSDEQDTLSEVKIDITNDNECGDVEQTSPKINNYFVVDNNMADGQLQVIYNLMKVKKYKSLSKRFLNKKHKRNKHFVTFKNINSKCRKATFISNRIEKRYKKIPPSIKAASAKVNLLAGTDLITLKAFETLNLKHIDNELLDSSQCTVKKSFLSQPSENTLVCKSSSSSKTDDWYLNAVNSVIQIPPDKTPYKTEVINVAVAVTYNSPKMNERRSEAVNNERLNQTEMPKNATYVIPPVPLSSRSPSPDIKNSTDNNITPTGLINSHRFNRKSISFISSDDDTYEIARTSSEFNRMSMNSDVTLTSNSETLIRTETICPDHFCVGGLAQHNIIPDTSNILDTVINLGMFSEMTASSSSAANYDSDHNKVIVTKNVITNFGLNTKNKGDDLDVNKELSKNVLKKSFNVENDGSGLQKNVSLPNEATIKSILKEQAKIAKSCSAEASHHPTDLSEMWDRLILVLDLAVKRLEETLAEKIIRELKISLSNFLEQAHSIPNITLSNIESKDKETDKEEKPATKEATLERIETFIQCDLVQNQQIDQLMAKLSGEGPIVVPESSGLSLRELKKKIVKDYFEVLKPPAVASHILDVGKADIAVVSAEALDGQRQEYRVSHRLKALFSGPISFLRENVIVMTSVPTFFFVLFCFYSIIILIVKPW